MLVGLAACGGSGECNGDRVTVPVDSSFKEEAATEEKNASKENDVTEENVVFKENVSLEESAAGEDFSGVNRTDTEVGGGYKDSLDWIRCWSGNWYGWWMMKDVTGAYADIKEGAWDACAYIEVYENLTGYMELWDEEGSHNLLIADMNLGFANPDDSQFGVMFCMGGQFLGDELEPYEWIINPDGNYCDNSIGFSGRYEDAYGSYSYYVILLPWGTTWEAMGEESYPEHYYDWYLPLIEAGEDMPDSIG